MLVSLYRSILIGRYVLHGRSVDASIPPAGSAWRQVEIKWNNLRGIT